MIFWRTWEFVYARCEKSERLSAAAEMEKGGRQRNDEVKKHNPFKISSIGHQRYVITFDFCVYL